MGVCGELHASVGGLGWYLLLVTTPKPSSSPAGAFTLTLNAGRHPQQTNCITRAPSLCATAYAGAPPELKPKRNTGLVRPAGPSSMSWSILATYESQLEHSGYSWGK